MSDLDKIIESLAEQQEEPAEGHFERFSGRLGKQRRKTRFYTAVIRVAAVLVFTFLSASLFFWLSDRREDHQISSVQADEIREAGIYYTGRINSEMNDLEKMRKEGIGSEREVLEIRKELSQMDRQFQNLEQDYQSNPNDERVRNAVIEYYQAKLEILNTIKSDWENAGQLKINYHENNKS
jgi:hypothetical protein